MAKNVFKKCGVFIFVMILAIVGGIVNTSSNVNAANTTSMSINVTPNPITTQAQVTMDVDLAASQDELINGSSLVVTIPKNIVSNSINVNDIAFPDDFGTPVITSSGSDYIITFPDYNSGGDAVIYHFQIKWRAPLWQENVAESPGEVNVNAELKDENNNSLLSEDLAVDTVTASRPIVPIFEKYTQMAKGTVNGQNGVAMMDENATPSNIFNLPVNYTQQNLSNVVITDELPEQTEFAQLSTKNSINASDASTTAENSRVRIFKATNFNTTSGFPSTFTNVTAQFIDKISITDNVLRVELGDLSSDDSYVVEYSVKPAYNETPESYGVKVNNAVMTSDSGTYNRSHKVAIKDIYAGSIAYRKQANQEKYVLGEEYIEYTLSLVNKSADEVIPVDSIISDTLIDGLTFDSIVSSEKVTTPIIDLSENTVSWKLNQAVNPGEDFKIVFKVKVDDSKFRHGDKINNIASLNMSDGRTIYTNASNIVVLMGKIKVIKIDQYNDLLDNAKFDVTNLADNSFVEKLITQKGIAITQSLEAGDYNVKEVAAPVGYKLLEEDIPVKISHETVDDDGIVEITVLNKKPTGDIELIKQDYDDASILLEGAKFKLVNNNGEVITQITTDKNGKAYISNIPFGEYLITEIQAPNGYILNEQPIKVNLKEDNEDKTVVKVIIKNKKEIIPLTTIPKTGSNDVVYMLILFSAAVGSILIYKRIKA